jgi:hypothetical protein
LENSKRRSFIIFALTTGSLLLPETRQAQLPSLVGAAVSAIANFYGKETKNDAKKILPSFDRKAL